MKICMLVYNNGTKDGRVMKEAHSLRAAGHEVTVIGVPDADARAPVEYLADGVRVYRVLWQANAYFKLLRSALFRIVPVLAIFGLIIWGIILAAGWALSSDGPLSAIGAWSSDQWDGVMNATWSDYGYAAGFILIALVVGYVGWRMVRGYAEAVGTTFSFRSDEKETMLRYAEAMFKEQPYQDLEFPQPRSRIPSWIPDFVLAMLLEPLDWFGAKSGRFTLYGYRSEEMAALAIKLKPDVIHCHDCMALPTGFLVKEKLKIPLIYDAHEIYESAAARAFGINDYYARLHRKYLPRVDHFITINDSIALYYRYAYPDAPSAVVIRNATNKAAEFVYDGRMHAAAGIPRSQKILLYQGGYTQERGLSNLVRAGQLLPDDWNLIMLGWGPLSGYLKQVAAYAAQTGRKRGGGAESKVRFLSAVPRRDLHYWTAGASAGIIPYENRLLNHWFCSPNKLWEYPNAGVPLVVQPFPELKKVVETFGCGWVLPDNPTPGQIADLIGGLTDEMIERAREGCRRFIDADCWEAVYEPRLVELYGAIAASQPIPLAKQAELRAAAAAAAAQRARL
jgi:glycosyltransferase involved in cell wall biosynthesis